MEFFSEKVLIKGVVYQSLRKAATNLKESRPNLMRKIKDTKNRDYKRLETTSYKKRYKERSIACQINNINYLSLNNAAKTLKQSPSTIKKRCESFCFQPKKYPNYFFLNKKVQV